MARFLSTLEIVAEIGNIIKKAKNKVVMLSPYNDRVSTQILQYLKESPGNIEITLIYGKKPQLNKLDPERFRILNLNIHLHENLHAKCYFKDSITIAHCLLASK